MSTQDNINEIAKVIRKAMTAQEAASRGLVPQSGNPDKPGRWIKDPKAEAGSQKERSATSATVGQLKDAEALDREVDKFFDNPRIQARIKNMNSEQRAQFAKNIADYLLDRQTTPKEAKLAEAITEVADKDTINATIEALKQDGRLEDMTRRDAANEIASTIGELVSQDYENANEMGVNEAYDFEYIRENVPEAEFVITQILDGYEWKDERS